ncbi:hypothetical protein Tco_0988713 [Tanacetum coccineum]|uniref:Reverse transcriptase domain-containing protein n=1 Tax=Tanacetum coccineum TaxID=301880 RepID=A0ABQ5ERU6_9ASTR
MNDHLKAHRDFQQPSQYRKIPICYDDDDDEYSFATQEYLKKFSFAITPDLPKLNSLIMEDGHLDTIPETKSDELIKSSVEDLVHTPSEFDGISEGEFQFHREMIDLPIQEFAGELALIAPIPPGIVEADLDPKGDIRFIENLMYDNSFPRPPETLKDDYETVIDSNNDYSSSNDDSYEDIDYVDASPPYSKLVSLEEVKDFHPKDGEIEDDILREKLSKINLLIAKIEALNANPTPSSDFILKSPIPIEDGDSFLEKFETNPELETFKFDIEEKNSGSTTIHANISLLDLKCFYFKSKPDPGELPSIIDFGIRENVSSMTNVNLPFEDD